MFLSAGHSKIDPGAVAFGRREADIAAEFRNIVSFYLMREGVAHDVDGRGTDNVPLREAVIKMRGHRVGLEFHCNADESPQATGVEALCGAKDRRLAALVCAAIARSLNIRNRGAKPEDSGQHQRLAFVQAGGIIVELFFLTNLVDLQSYEARKWLAGREVAHVLASHSMQAPR